LIDMEIFLGNIRHKSYTYRLLDTDDNYDYNILKKISTPPLKVIIFTKYT